MPRRRLWLLTREGVAVTDAGGQTVEVPLPGWLVVAPPYGCPADLALGPSGEAVVTRTSCHRWRIDPETLAVSVHPLALDPDAGKDIGFSRLVYSSEEHAFFAVADHHGSLWRIDPELSQAHMVQPSETAPRKCLAPTRSRPHRAGGGWCPGNGHPFVAARGC